MVNFLKSYEDLHSRKSDNVINLGKNYADILSDENKNIVETISQMRSDLDTKLDNVFKLNFLMVQSEVNKNKRTVRKYLSTPALRDHYSAEAKARAITFKNDLLFVEMNKKQFDNMTLDDKQLRYLPGSPTSILEQILVDAGFLADNSAVHFIVGPDAKKAMKLMGYTEKVYVYDDYKPKKAVVAPGEKVVRVPALQLPLFSTADGMKTYQQMVDENRVMIINRGNEHWSRDLSGITRRFGKDNIRSMFTELYKYTGDETFLNRKFGEIKMGDYKRISKFIKADELPTWDEILQDTFTRHKEYVTNMYNLAVKRTVKNAKSLFASYTENCYDTAKAVAKKLGTLTPKQQDFIEDLRKCAEVRKGSCDYRAGEWAGYINSWFYLGVADPRNNSNVELDLNLDTKWPWVDILNTYHCDEESAMEFILKIADTYQ